MPETAVGSIPWNYLANEVQAGKNLVCIHGAGEDASHWPEGLLNLEEAGVYICDLPGHGQSGGTGLTSIAEYADAAWGFVSALGLESVVIAGHSMGGAIAMSMALSRPDRLDGIILVATGARLRVHPAILEALLADFESAVEQIADTAFSANASREIVEKACQGFLRTGQKTFHQDLSACNRFDIMDRVESIRVPALVISGDRDLVTPVKYGDFLADRIQRATHTVMENTGHMMALEQPEAFVECIREFLCTLGNRP